MAITLNRTGLRNGGADPLEYYLKQFAGEILTSAHENLVMEPLITVRNITKGKSANFPALGTAVAGYHVPGDDIAGQQIKNGEKIINIDSLLTAATWIYDLDEAMQEYDLRSQYAQELGFSLAKFYNDRALRVVVLAARATTNAVGDSIAGGARLIANDSFKTDASVLRDALFTAAQKLDDLLAPAEDRHCVLPNAQFYLLAQNTQIYNRDFGTGAGNYSQLKLPPVANIQIHQCVSFPYSANGAPIAAVTGENNTYNGDFNKTKGVVFQRRATGCVRLMNLAFERERSAVKQSDFVVAKQAIGHGHLRPEWSVELATSTAN